MQLFFSPHLDDVVLSAPGRVLEAVSSGQRVVVATVFSQGGDDGPSRALYARRRAEDRRGVTALGAEPIYLDLPDAPFRNPFYRSFRPIVLGYHPDDDAWTDQLKGAVSGCVLRYKPRRIFLPLAVGTHIDHRLAHRTWSTLPGEAEVLFYEDRPYAFVRHAVAMRLAELGVPMTEEEVSPRHRLHSYLQSLRRTRYVRTYLPPGPERLLSALQLARQLRAPPRAAGGLTLSPQTLTLNETGFESVLKAVACYESQLPDLFGNAEGYRAAACAYSLSLDPRATYAERSWRLERG